MEVSNVTDCSADLQWKAPDSDGGSPLTSYIIEMRPDSRSTWTKAGSVDGTTNNFTVPDLKVDTEYHFRVSAVNAEGQSAPLEGKETAKPTKKISECLHFVLVVIGAEKKYIPIDAVSLFWDGKLHDQSIVSV